MVKCARCRKRPAMIFVTKVENGQKSSEGLCIVCAKELGLPLENMMGGALDKLGLTPDQLASMSEEMEQMFEQGLGNVDGLEELDEADDADENNEGADAAETKKKGSEHIVPTFDFRKLFEQAGLISNDKPNAPVNQNENAGDKKSARGERASKDPEKKYKYLPAYCRNLTKSAREGKLDRIIGRDKELARVIQILCRRQKNNPCLIGEPGVGKTAIAEALALRIAQDDVPYKLKNKVVYLLDLTSLVAGTQFRGQFEARIQGLINEIKDAGNVLLVIDEVHNLVGTGNSEGSMNAANILKPALSRGEIQVIGATTLNEYRKFIEKDAALERRFQPVIVDEPSVEETVDMLRGIKHYYEEFHGIIVPDELLRRTVVLSERYITDRYLPDKAIDLLDEAASYLSLNTAVINESYDIRDQLLKLKAEREALEAQTGTLDGVDAQRNYEQIAHLRGKELKLSARLQEIEPECAKVELTVEQLAAVIEVWTGVPASTISENEFEKLSKLEDKIKSRIIGQDEAVHAVVRAIKRNRAGISYKRKPVSFIFAGPTGVGKTELVKTIASELFHTPETLIRLDMSEFMEKHSVSRIIGAPPGYVGYDEAGQLTEKIRRHPYSVVLFDEIEKAHPDVLNILLQILDDGRITDAGGKTVNFENAIIVMTTNAGSDRTSSAIGFFDDGKSLAESKTEKALSTFLRPEFINRVDEIITFRSLDEKDFARIAGIMLGDLAHALEEKDMHFTYTPAAAALIAEKSYSVKFGARNMRRYIQREVEDALAEKLLADQKHAITQIRLSVSGGRLTLDCM
ncbi:MAG: ATP-dependent Clp protease ATP-binding subunit [Ruminococcaceae bacterium]|nr:ATP-dependent Clp protease ATP-binding subunit [Oscillospiraceae bacterium]